MSRREPRSPEPVLHETVITGVDIPFVTLTLFFVKASLAAALAFVLTSVVWLVLGAGVAGIGITVLVLSGATDLRLAPTPTAVAPVEKVAPATSAPSSAPEPAAAPPVAATAVRQPAPAVEEPEVTGEPEPPVSSHDAATRALQLQELERIRNGRHRYDQVPTR